jgi:hypothetical protein
MKFVFIIDNRHVYRYLSSLIEESLKRKHKVEILHLSWNVKSMPIELSPFFVNDQKNLIFHEIPSENDLVKYIEQSNSIQYFFSIHPVMFKFTNLALKKVTGRWCIIQHGHDSFATIWHWQYFGFSGDLHQNYNRLFFPHTSFFYNKGIYWLKKYSDSQNKDNYSFFESSKTSVIPIGSTMYNGSSKIINSSFIRKKYNVTSSNKIVLYLPFSFVAFRSKYSKNGSYAWQAAFSGLFLKYKKKGDSKFQKIKNYLVFFLKKIIYLVKVLSDLEALNWLIRRWNEPQVIKEVKKFCDNNDLILIVKPRLKFPYVGQVYKSSRVVIDNDFDTQYNPSLLQELFSISDLVIGYQSTTVLESVLNNTPYLNIEPPPSNLNNDEARLFFHSCDEGEMYNYNGVVKSMKIPELISNLNHMSLSDFKFNAQEKSKYKEKYLGEEDSNSSENLINYLEANKKGFL